VYVSTAPPEPGGTGLRVATNADLDTLVPACALAHEEEVGVDPLRRDPNGFRWRTRTQIEEGRSWIWLEDGVIRFKAEASAWTPAAVQLQQVWVDPPARRQGYGSRALRDLIRLLLESVPAVCLFVRAENAPAIRLYETVGMQHALAYRSVLF
jgi:predicted GNAT family acetyltransferase